MMIASSSPRPSNKYTNHDDDNDAQVERTCSKYFFCDWIDVVQDFCSEMASPSQAANAANNSSNNKHADQEQRVSSTRWKSTQKPKSYTVMEGPRQLPISPTLSFIDERDHRSDKDSDEADDDLVPIVLCYEYDTNQVVVEAKTHGTPIHRYEPREQGTCPLGHQEVIMFKKYYT